MLYNNQAGRGDFITFTIALKPDFYSKHLS